jgi:hypothetical protein
LDGQNDKIVDALKAFLPLWLQGEEQEGAKQQG